MTYLFRRLSCSRKQGERKTRLDEIVTIEKVKVEEAREHRKMMLDIEREMLALDKQWLQNEAEKKEKEEDERILAIYLDQCLPMQRMYYIKCCKKI